MQEEQFFSEICLKLKLGSLLEKPLRVYGGLMHEMYCIKTGSGFFMVKLLNPKIMQRKDALNNFHVAETLEAQLEKADIPVVAALQFNGAKMQCINNQYFYIFNRIDGHSMQPNEITKEHCSAIASVLADIHKIEMQDEVSCKQPIMIDWHGYINMARGQCEEIAELLNGNIDIIYKSQNEGNSACKKLPQKTAICHGDMDSKNVLWVCGNPQIIDLECLKRGNPYLEFFELALCWSGYESCDMNYELLKAFVTSYIKKIGVFVADWNTLYLSNNARLEWLEYNVKRALSIESSSEEERLRGVSEVRETIKHILFYDKIKDELLAKLQNS